MAVRGTGTAEGMEWMGSDGMWSQADPGQRGSGTGLSCQGSVRVNEGWPKLESDRSAVKSEGWMRVATLLRK